MWTERSVHRRCLACAASDDFSGVATWPTPSMEEYVKIKRHGVAVSLLVAGVLMLTACGSDQNTDTGSSGSTNSADNASSDVACGGKQSLKVSGSSAQANAM